jgi:hypothetical protein
VTRKRRQPTKRARERAAEFGPLRPVKPTRWRESDRSPLLEEGQVYVFGGGSVFHSAWCGTVGGYWDRYPTSLKIVWRSEVGSRRECQNCLTAPLTGNF